MQYLYNIPGMEDVEDVIVVRSDMAELPGVLFHAARRHRVHGLAALTVELQVLLLPHLLRRASDRDNDETASAGSRIDRRGQGRRHHARHRAQMALETWGYEDECNPGCRQIAMASASQPHRPRRIRSLDHPGRNPAGHDLCARNSQHGKKFRHGVRIEKMRNSPSQGLDRNRLQFPGQTDHCSFGYGDHVSLLLRSRSGEGHAHAAAGRRRRFPFSRDCGSGERWIMRPPAAPAAMTELASRMTGRLRLHGARQTTTAAGASRHRLQPSLRQRRREPRYRWCSVA